MSSPRETAAAGAIAPPERIVIDTDPGQDDAVALLLALANPARLTLLGITTVAGNVPVAQATINALRIRDLADADVPVHAGAETPLLAPLETAEFVCGPDGLAGAALPQPWRAPEATHAVLFLIETLRSAPEPVTLCMLGPLTNLALALRIAPDIRTKVGRIVLMGGALALGNMTPAAEFNFYVDPHAAAVVFASGIPLVQFGLHATHQAVPSPADLAAIAALPGAAARAVHGMLTRPRPGGLGTAAHPMHDPCVVAFLLRPELFSGRDCFLEVETGPGSLRGRSTIDWNGRLKRPPNAFVVDRVDAAGLFALIRDALAHLP